MWLFACFIILLSAVLCLIISKHENRNTTRWFWYGIFFGIYAVIYLVFYTKDNDQDKIKKSIMFLLGILEILIFMAIYQTFFGYLIK